MVKYEIGNYVVFLLVAGMWRFCTGHGQLTQTIEAHKDNDGASEILQSTWNEQLSELEKRIILLLKESFTETKTKKKCAESGWTQTSIIEE